VVSGFETDIGAGKEVGISVTITNPPSSVITNKFTIAAFRNNTSVIYTWRNDVNGKFQLYSRYLNNPRWYICCVADNIHQWLNLIPGKGYGLSTLISPKQPSTRWIRDQNRFPSDILNCQWNCIWLRIHQPRPRRCWWNQCFVNNCATFLYLTFRICCYRQTFDNYRDIQGYKPQQSRMDISLVNKNLCWCIFKQRNWWEYRRCCDKNSKYP
jgi:hypothetical protein